MAHTTASQSQDELRIIGKRYYGRWFSALFVLLLLAGLLHSVFNNPRFEWGVVAQSFTEESILSGVLMTLQLTAISVVLGFAGGTVLALMRLSSNPVLVAVSWGYTWFFRGVPMLVQLFLWYNIAALYPTISVTLPGIGELYSSPANALISPFSAAVIALVMHQSAYAAEIIRAGIQSVGNGQLEAARALGYSRGQIFRHTVLPQAMRAILPPAGNEVIGQLKTTAVVSVISLQDVLYSAQIIYQRTYEVIPLLLVATAWYLLLTSVLSVGQFYVERYFSRGVKRVEAKVWFARKLPVYLLNARRVSNG
ncbi:MULTISPECIES: amino acid ABC transporter permease [Kosakonia]|jgi:polar amino acid transport system permease protein|uniref:Glutamate/aspartate import permease protein GltK n=1 Tax=Kosakonia oryzae TaxID=497725 RepID=A0AA94H7Y6_9ENTR|nr:MULTISPECIES: amino acid ABC transporter permease [Kosakonia]ANI80827.1 amino acid ABC transporter permease [Kosakonia oryzae]APG20387.1 amino acid ABC transporter permease [Kosakonia radicincitans]ARD58587.1 amino acid ABC transporter permease [Kosakonia radicincitans DSM 16656]KDE36485.1 amino acid ABC transporter permease [Kosakonia radicincitans UMEnt01/12]KIS42643.1 amino ABC transporter, permease, 3-TM region, His/Glu/Gln/Arg/opine family domain protein [Kosakonia radicincitans YD4]